MPSTSTDRKKGVLFFSIPLFLLLITESSIGVLYPEIYQPIAASWLEQTMAQDEINLFFVIPLLLVFSIYACKNSKIAFLSWAGILLYISYTFLIYCFAIRFNVLFVLYCLTLGISVYGFAWSFIRSAKIFPTGLVSYRALQLTGIYFISLSIVFYLLWLSDVLPATFSSQVPESVAAAGLFTNPVHVIDLSLFLPAVFAAGIMALKRRPRIGTLAPVLLSFIIMMDITIGFLNIRIMQSSKVADYTMATIMAALVLISLILFIPFSKKLK